MNFKWVKLFVLVASAHSQFFALASIPNWLCALAEVKFTCECT